MQNARAILATVAILGLLAVPALAKKKCIGDNVVHKGEQCDGTADSACPGMCTDCQCPPVKTLNIKSKAQPPNTPGTSGVQVTSPLLFKQFGSSFSLNKARYTRFQLAGAKGRPDAILVLIPGFEGGAANFRILAQNLLSDIHTKYGRQIEVWAFDRRTNQLEDTVGLDIAEKDLDPMLGVNWLFGQELGLPWDKRLPKRHHAVFYNTQGDVPFLANWTNLVFSQDIDAVVNAALKKAKNKNVFLGGHSAGTGFTARYASTDFNITPSCNGTPQPGYAKLRGLVLLEGMGGSTAGGLALTDDSLDRMIAKFDGGLFGAVRDNAARCVDGTTACSIATEASACSGQVPAKCTLPTTSYARIDVLGIPVVNPRVCAQAEPLGIQAVNDPNTGEGVTSLSGAEDLVPDLAGLKFAVPPATVEGGFGTFLDKDSFTASLEPFLAMSLGEPGPTVDGLLTWKDILHGGSPPSPPVVFGPWNTQCTGASTPYACCTGAGTGTCDVNADCTAALTPHACCTGAGTGTCTVNAECTGDATPYVCCTGAGTGTCTVPIALSNPLPKWGEDKEVTRLDRVLAAFFVGQTNFTDWYYPVAGPSTTSVTGVCTSSFCAVGNVGAPCSVDADCSQSINLDSTKLSAPSPTGRGRCNIENLTQAANINIPVIGFSGTQGLATLPGVYTAFGQSIGICTALSCDGTTPRVVDAANPNPAFPTFGDIRGGFEVYVNEGFSHLDVLTAENDDNNNVIAPLSYFISRNIQ